MAIAEERLPVSDLTTLSNVIEDDMLVTQTAGANGDVMLVPISALVTLLNTVFAQLDSPQLTGEPTAPDIADPTAEDDRIANTAFVQAVAARKADLQSPSFTGTAHFAEHIPTTVNGDGEDVYLATQDDIQELTESISTLAQSIQSLNTTVSNLSLDLNARLGSFRYYVAEYTAASSVSLATLFPNLPSGGYLVIFAYIGYTFADSASMYFLSKGSGTNFYGLTTIKKGAHGATVALTNAGVASKGNGNTYIAKCVLLRLG